MGRPPSRHSQTRRITSFAGWVAFSSDVRRIVASDPRLVILVTVDEPKLAIFGGIVAAPAFAQIAAFDLQYLEVRPDLPLR